MRRILPKAIIFSLLAICFLASAEKYYSSAQTDASAGVLEVVRQFQSAAIRGDQATLNQTFDLNITHFHPGSPYRFVGRDRLVQEFEIASKNQQDMHFEMVDPQVQMAGRDAAVVTYYIVEDWTEKGGPRSAKEKATEVYVKKDGRWIMIHGHYSTE
jgi:ketosteroid isomerase-like protein